MPNIDPSLLASNFGEILDAVYNNESTSGMDKRAYRINSVGALGGYQIKRDTFKHIQQIAPSKWKKVPFEGAMMKDDVSREAASDYFSWLRQYLASHGIVPSEDTLLAAYHAGPGNVVNGKIGPKTRAYVEKGLEFIRKRRGVIPVDEDQVAAGRAA